MTKVDGIVNAARAPKLSRYGQCIVQIQPFSDGRKRDCLKPAGHGPQKMYCWQHAHKIAERSNPR